MADSSNTPKLDARIEAAGHAIYFAWNNTAYLREAAPPEEGECRTFAEHALAAADSVERPAVERLVAALRDICESKMVNLNSTHRCVPNPIIERAIAALAEFGQQPTDEGERNV